LFLHVSLVICRWKNKAADRLHHSDDALVGKKVLIVDDDVRTSSPSAVLLNAGHDVITRDWAGSDCQAESTRIFAIVLMTL